MLNVVRFSVEGIPQTKGSTRQFIPKGWTRAIITNDNPKNKDWAKKVHTTAAYKFIGETPWVGPVELNVIFWMKKPKSHPSKRFVWHTKKPDLDKIIRSIKDAMSGVIYEDDRQIVHVNAWKFYATKPGVDIEVLNLTSHLKLIEHCDCAYSPLDKDKSFAKQAICISGLSDMFLDDESGADHK